MIQTVAELTSSNYNELSYNGAGTLIKGEYITYICLLLNKCGVKVATIDEYDDTVSSAVSKFQELVDLPATGSLNDETFQRMILYSQDKMSDSIESDDDEESIQEPDTLPHYDSFFGDDKTKMHRRNHKDIKIVFGNSSITKTIKDVFMLSVSVEVDTSGNPISEVYEFIARDVVETDELTDIEKYATYEHATASEYAEYDFSSIGIK